MDILESVCDKLSLTRVSDDDRSPPKTDGSTPTTTTSQESLLDETKDDTPAPTDSWPTTSESWDGDDELSPLQEVQGRVARVWGKRHSSRYKNAIVLLIRWEENDFDEEMEKKRIHKYEMMFKHLYNYDVWRFEIPNKKPRQALAAQLTQLAAEDSPETLFVIWYDGHGREHADRRGPPMWCSHENPKISQSLDSGILSTNLGDCEADILLVNNACDSLTCDRFTGGGIVESISASAFNTSTYGSVEASDLSPSMTWAVHRILSDETCVESGITVAELHRRICLATQWAGSNKYADYDEFDCDSYGVEWHTSYIRTQPVYTRLSADAAGPGGTTRSIVLRRLTEPHWGPASHNMQICVRLGIEHLDRIDPKEWTDWITSAPSSVLTANLEMVEDQGNALPQ